MTLLKIALGNNSQLNKETKRAVKVQNEFGINIEETRQIDNIINIDEVNASRKKEFCFLIRNYAPWLFWWDLLIIILAIAFTIFSPLDVAFNPHWVHTYWYKALDITVYIFFFVDIIFKFLTSYISHDGDEEI